MNIRGYYFVVDYLERTISNAKVYDLPIDVWDVYFGATKRLKIPVFEKCPKCDGKGYRVLEKECAICNGTGKLKIVHQTYFANIIETFSCPNCLGTGRVIEKCTCNNGRIIKYETIEVKIPKGAQENQLILIRKPDQYNKPIYARIIIADDIFEINKLDLILKVALTREQVLDNKLITIKHPLKELKVHSKEIAEKRLIFEGYGLFNSKTKGNLIVKGYVV